MTRPPAPESPAALPFDGGLWSEAEPVARELLERPVESPAEFERWLLDRSAFDAACSEARANRYIAMTRRTDDEAASGEWKRYLEETAPALKKVDFDLDRRHAELSDRFGAALDRRRYEVLERDTRNAVELFREENIPLETRLARLDQEYDAVCAAQTVEFEGEERTLAQMGRFLQETDRRLRERAWRVVSERRLADRERIETIFDEMVRLRHETATNAGFENFRDFMFRKKGRFDYGPEHCAAFHDACERVVKPMTGRFDRRRAAALGVDALRPWDLSVDEKGRAPLRPFEGAQEMVDATARVFRRMGGGLDEMFDELREATGEDAQLDLESRKGKAPGGYQYQRDCTQRPFIFMNAAGLHRDVRTLIHEAGHAFHSLLCRREPLVNYRHSPIEFAEVASMSMELLSMPYWDEYYPDPSDADRARREQLEGVIEILPWIATIDAFQHGLYLDPGHSRQRRAERWLAIHERFGRAVSWDGLEDARRSLWQRQPHLFGAPFYYIEYGIAQLGALQLWLVARERGLEEALDRYKRALSLGGSRPLPELFAAAGLEFDFGPATVERLVGAAGDALDELPE